MRFDCDDGVWMSEIQNDLPKGKYLSSDVHDDLFAVDRRINCARELEILRRRNVSRLMHFTHVDNLDGILHQGLLPPESLREGSYRTGLQRGECERNCICCSISFPDYVLFTKTWDRSRKDDYIILGISLEVLNTFGEREVAYIPDNARADGVSEKFSDYVGVNPLIDIFKNNFPCRNREFPRYPALPDCYTSSPEAEILFKGEVSIGYISEVYVYSKESKEFVEKLLEIIGYPLAVKVAPGMYGPREDYQMWDRIREEVDRSRKNELNYLGQKKYQY